jgi:hypothetical protein
MTQVPERPLPLPCADPDVEESHPLEEAQGKRPSDPQRKECFSTLAFRGDRHATLAYPPFGTCDRHSNYC